MRCPYRTTNVRYNDGKVRFDRTDFEECYKDECPFWHRAISTAGEGEKFVCMREMKFLDMRDVY